MLAEIFINEEVNKYKRSFSIFNYFDKILETMKITKIINKYDILFKLKDRDEECKKSVKKLQRMLCRTELDNSQHMLNMK